MFLLALLLYAILGCIAGILAGLLGIGGGVVTVPALFLIFYLLDFPLGCIMHLAIGTSLASMIFNSLSSTYSHNKKHAVLWDLVKKMLLGFVIGSLLGALLAHLLSEKILEIIFGVFALMLGIYFLWPARPIENKYRVPSNAILNMLAIFIGGISNILGIGGGTMTMPTFLLFGIDGKKAVGTSAATGLIITVLGAVSYLYLGLHHSTVKYSLGYLYLPAFIMISITSFFTAPMGVRIAHAISSSLLKRIFACVLIVAGGLMIFFK